MSKSNHILFFLLPIMVKIKTNTIVSQKIIQVHSIPGVLYSNSTLIVSLGRVAFNSKFDSWSAIVIFWHSPLLVHALPCQPRHPISLTINLWSFFSGFSLTIKLPGLKETKSDLFSMKSHFSSTTQSSTF